MFIYIVLFLFMLWLLLVRNSSFYKSNMSRKFILFNTMIFLLILYVFRSKDVGSDYPMYNSFFNFPANILKANGIELIYRFFNSIAQYYSNFLLVPFIIFIIFLIGLICLVKIFKVNQFTFLSYFIITYFYLSSFNIMRQYSAIGIMGIGIALYFYFYQYHLLKYILFILLALFASLFHSTAIFCILFVIFPKIYVSEKKVIITTILTSFLFFTNIVTNLSNILFNYFPSYASKYPSGLTAYPKGIIQFLPVLIQFVFIYIYVKYNKVINYKVRFILSGYLFFLFLYSGGGDIILVRLQMYSYIFPVLFGCLFMDNNNMPVKDKNSLTRYYKYIFVLFWSVYFISKLIINSSGVVPYSFV